MKEIAVLLRTMQLYSHNSHNLVKGSLFFQDHDFLGELYPKYESEYDSLIERMLGLGIDFDILLIQIEAVEQLKSLPSNFNENKECLKILLEMEQSLCSLIEAIIRAIKPSEGSRQMLGEMCNQSEMRQYKLSQRVKK